MKAIYFILTLLFIFSCKKEKNDDNRVADVHCDDSITLKKLEPLYFTAAKLEISDPTNPLKNQPELPILRVEEKLNALKAIAGLNDPNADSVFKLYAIPYRYYQKGDAQYIVFLVDDFTEDDRKKELANSIIKSTVSQQPLRNLYEKYKIQFVNNTNMWGNHEITVKTCGLLNVSAIAHELQSKTSLRAYPATESFVRSKIGIDKTHITTTKKPASTEYDFSIGYGQFATSWSYPFWHHWVFSIDQNGNATFVRCYGDPAPL